MLICYGWILCTECYLPVFFTKSYFGHSAQGTFYHSLVYCISKRRSKWQNKRRLQIMKQQEETWVLPYNLWVAKLRISFRTGRIPTQFLWGNWVVCSLETFVQLSSSTAVYLNKILPPFCHSHPGTLGTKNGCALFVSEWMCEKPCLSC